MDTSANDKSDKQVAPQSSQGLGVNKFIYAAGYSAKDGFVWGVGIFAALVTLLTFGKGVAPIRWFEKQLMAVHAWTQKLPHKLGIEEAVKGPVVALSIAISFLLSHLAMGPGFALGLRKAKEANDKYAALSEERDQLVMANDVLKKDAEQLKTQLDDAHNNRPSFVERTSQPAVSGVSNSI